MKKSTHKTARSEVSELEQIINIGPAIAGHLQGVAIDVPSDLIGKDPLMLWEKICRHKGAFQDPCLLDCIIAAVDYMDGNPPQKWWDYTEARKEKYSDAVDEMRRL